MAVPWQLSSATDAVLRLSSRPGVCWLDGETEHVHGGRSFVASDPVRWLRVGGDVADPLAALAELDAPAADSEDLPELARHAPRWVGYVAYDAFHSGRPRRHRQGDPGDEAGAGDAGDAGGVSGVSGASGAGDAGGAGDTGSVSVVAGEAGAGDAGDPVLAFARYDAVLVIDHAAGAAWLVGDDAAACERLSARLSAPARTPRACAGPPSVTPPAAHRAAIARALEHIAAGDIYQVNLARRFVASFAGDPVALFLAMRAQGAVPFGLYQRDGDHALLCRSMERFLHWQRAPGVIETRPIKGTLARRGGRDASEAAQLRADPKEQAEHAMIVDLMRNDLGRVARFGSVEVEGVMTVEPFAGLSHLVSTVRCRARPGLTLAELLGATFPPGSVTGTPKLRAIQVIEALEPAARGVYTGAVGYVDRAGDLSLSVAIRTATVRGDRACYWAGGGIVEASVAERELAETELKARVFLDALSQLDAR